MPDDAPVFAAWLAVLTPDEQARVRADFAEFDVASGSIVVQRGDPSDHWIGVVRGLVKLASAAPDGRSTTFAGVPPGGWFGEGALLKREPRRYDVIALSDSRLVRLPRATFEWLLERSIPFNRWLLTQFNARLGQFIGIVERERLLDPDAKAARVIADLFDPILYPGTGLRLPISQTELALLVGVSRQRTNQSLQTLENAGLLAVEYGAIQVLDLEALRAWGS
jgi:CRP/FNR family transcriptional regulator, cyclic AMP receptor protein